ncbi:glycosyltransferase 87 family protein [Pseudoclavibacter sp. 13-3]|uniref:glycosyltransferase 87 family protein n=1 Tax=Pseudoclavibacter sp. 13-3 TaxID=2901228 RepID=UPI001E2BB354|nr:glycosyltransferase 87 family protein [Pseudoclavibacter sp. 13-3]MCD7101386.1 glycosyltransferase 87 family protein [Pseudoclavibacter sp. 13-3]
MTSRAPKTHSAETIAAPRTTSLATAVGRIAARPSLLIVAFLVVHLWLALSGRQQYGAPFGDVTSVYHLWSFDTVRYGTWYGITDPWVYPALALVTMLLPLTLWAATGLDYTFSWLIMVTLLNVVALGVFTEGFRNARRMRAAWWWAAYLLLLGPVALGRVDTVALALVIIALSLLEHRPALTGLLLAVGAWVKVWPAAVLAAAVASFWGRGRRMLGELIAPGVALTGALAAVAAVASLVSGRGLAGIGNLLGFVGGQASRNLQIEAVGATVGLWQARSGDGAVVYNHEIYTNELISASSPVIATTVTVLMGVLALAIALLAWRLQRAGVDRLRVFAWTTLALVVTFIVCNKVGSPQFEVWLVAPVLLLAAVRAPRWWVPMVLSSMIAVLTQVIYPSWYGYLLNLSAWMLWVITVRNLLLVVLLIWAVAELRPRGCVRAAPRSPLAR